MHDICFEGQRSVALLQLVLQIRRGNRDNLGVIFLFFYHRDGSKKGSQHMFSFRNKKKLSLNYPQYPLLPGALNPTLLKVTISKFRFDHFHELFDKQIGNFSLTKLIFVFLLQMLEFFMSSREENCAFTKRDKC